jgi:serine/threonine-protein kinase RsbW
MYSDGVTDCFDRAGRGFDVEHLRAVLARESGLPAEKIVEALRQALMAWRDATDLEDDISVLIIERPAEPNHLRLCSDPTDLGWYALVRNKMQTVAAAARLEGQRATLLALAVVEAINNVIEHAYDNRAGHPIYLHVDRNPSTLVVTLRDRGLPMPMPLPAPDVAIPDSSSESGRGWPIIRSVFSDVHYRRRDDENELTLVCPLDPPGPEWVDARRREMPP